MKIYVTQGAESKGIRCVNVCSVALSKSEYEPLYVQAGLGVAVAVMVGETCELTEARAREVVRERAKVEFDRLMDAADKLDQALKDPDWPPVGRV